jgi:flavin reductase (DIM6/NTAB) family NADH-FMN oxidoreductase RutF
MSSAHAPGPVDEHLKHTVGRAIGRIPSGIFILTAQNGGEATAMLASWVQQAGFNPPAVSLAIARDRPAVEMIRQTKLFALSVLGEHDSALMKKYARGVPPAESLTGVNVRRTPQGLPVLADALAYMECRLRSVCEFGGDHDLYVAEVISGELLREGNSFMHQRGNGFHY